MRPPRRWPLHPHPGPLESLSSWTRRLARLYNIQVPELLGHNLGLVDLDIPADLDRDPPPVMLAALAERTAVDLPRVRATTLAGWVPWLFDSLTVEPYQAQKVFDSYVHANSVLLDPGTAGRHLVHRWKSWRSPWLSKAVLDRVCPLCAKDLDRGTALVWRLPLMISCAEHGYRLENRSDLEVALALDRPPPMNPVDEPVATMDRYTYEALTTGAVALSGRTVHAGVWFRLLRSLLNELSLATTTLNLHGRTIVEAVWRATGGEHRAGLSIWQPFEQLDWPTQETMLRAAATALALAADGRIVAHGVFGSVLCPAAHRPVHEGDRPPLNFNAMMDEVIAEARRDRAAARQLMNVLTFGCRSIIQFDEQRAYLVGLGVPADFIPGAQELGRPDLLQ